MPRLALARRTTVARQLARWARRCTIAPTSASSANAAVTGVRLQLGATPGASPSATCQSAYSNTLPSWSQNGAWRGHSDATSYCRRPTTATRACSVAGLPWLIAGSCCARTSSTSSAETPIPTATAIWSRMRGGVSRHAPSAIASITAPVASTTGDAVPTPAATTIAPESTAPSRHHMRARASCSARTIAAGAATSALRCRGAASAMQYPSSTLHRASRVVARRSATRSIASDRSSEAA